MSIQYRMSKIHITTQFGQSFGNITLRHDAYRKAAKSPAQSELFRTPIFLLSFTSVHAFHQIVAHSR